MGAISARVEAYIHDNDEKITLIYDHIKMLANDLAAAGLGNATGGFSAKDMLEHPTLRALVTSNNASVESIQALNAEVLSVRAELAAIRGEAAKRKRDTDEDPAYSADVLLPAVKRVQPTTLVPANSLPPVALRAPPTGQHDVPAAPPATSYVDLTSAAVPEAPPPISAQQNAGVDIGPIAWGKDISGQARGLIARMPRGNTIDTDAVKTLYAKRFPKNNKFITAYFPTNVTAIQFVNAWAAAPAPGYEKTSVSFASGN